MIYKPYFAIVNKEILDAIRDSKSLATAFLMPILFAAVSYGSMHFIASLQSQSIDITLPISGSEHAKPLVAWLNEAGVNVVEGPADPSAAIRAQKWDMVLIIPAQFDEQFRAQRSAQMDLLSDHSRSDSQPKVNRVRMLISQWSMNIASLRLITRNVSPTVANPVSINNINVTSDQRVAAKILGSLPMFMILIAFASGIGMASDMAAGERERKSLEPLLINPVSHTCIFLGKWTSCIAVTFIITLAGVALQFVAVNHAPLAELGIRLELGFGSFFIIAIILIPIICLASALQLLVSFVARSFKDAQSYNGLIIMLPMAPGMYLAFNSSSAELWQMFVPILGPTALFVDVISGDSVSLAYAMIASLISLALTAFFVALGVLVIKREKTIR
ncbi:MAG: sodium transport system permease protein [Lentisphaeria bacterium]|jgi:sodium transport system permease protein